MLVKDEDDCLWQDRELHFDAPDIIFKPRKGETVIDSINSVEDTKGNNGMRGSLYITNLRIEWIAHKGYRTNLSIGFKNILKLRIKKAQSKLRGVTRALFVTCKHETTRYEFIFTSLVNTSPRLFTTVLAVFKAYESTTLYRELRLRGAIVKDKSLRLLPGEEVYQTLPGVWNLSSEQGSLGTFVVTNIRIVWFADLANNFNVSIPYIQIVNVAINNSRFGDALVVETARTGGKYTLGFRIDPKDRLTRTLETITNLHAIFFKSPDFGVRVSVESAPKQSPFNAIEKAAEEDLSIEENVDDFIPASFSAAPRGPEAYLAGEPDESNGESKDPESSSDSASSIPVYNAHLGLAVQPLLSGASVQSLWSLVSGPSTSKKA